MRIRIGLLIVAFLVVIAALLLWRSCRSNSSPPQSTTATTVPASSAPTTPDSAPTTVYAHNLLLRKGPSFRVYVRWLRGQMVRARKNVNPSFDDPESFYLDIKSGVIRANIGDIANFLNSSEVVNSRLKNVTLSGDGSQIKLRGTVHKVIPLSIELTGTISAAPNSRIQIHVTKIDVLKIPFKALLGAFHITVSDLFEPKDIPGIQVSSNDILLDTSKLLPPPHIRGELTAVRVANPDLEEVYGNAETDVARVEQWRNFLRLTDGTIDFGKLTMHHVDLIMIDISSDPWFDLDLAHYQAQLVNGYTRMTPQAGLQIFMPDLRAIPASKAIQNIGIEWFKNRNLPPPSDVTKK